MTLFECECECECRFAECECENRSATPFLTGGVLIEACFGANQNPDREGGDQVTAVSSKALESFA